MPWVAGIFGFALTGYFIQTFGITSTFIAGAFLPLMAIIFMVLIRQKAPVKDFSID
jgi:predicted MFS family arabinose efflux permease